jgi:hypothetical protein
MPTPRHRQPAVLSPAIESYADYGPAGNVAATQLRSAPPKVYDFDRASLRDVLRLLADDAGIPFV